jgi:tetratricopeptide (TPR) repeat protein
MRKGLRFAMALVVVALNLTMVGCADTLVSKEGDMHLQAAQRFDVQGDYESAREQYRKALIDATQSGASPALISMLKYNYGRTSGYTCHLADAEKYLLEALDMERTITGPESGVSTKRLFELARLYFDQGEYEKSVDYYAKAVPAVEKLKLAESDPIALAEILDEYAVALANSGHGVEVAPISAEAAHLRAENIGKTARFVPVRYRCAWSTG